MLEIIAEAAQGFLGDPPRKTLDLADYAAAATADAVKFQLVYADELCTPDHRHYGLFGELEMPDAAWFAVANRCRQRGIRLYVDVFGPRSLELACALGVAGIKLHSTDVLNRPLLRAVASSPTSRIILSAGGTHRAELEEAVSILAGKDIVVMHGFQGYPTAVDENQITRIGLLRRQFSGCAMGFADHVPEAAGERHWLSAVAIGAGATVLEKHITTALVCREEDHESALSPDAFAEYAGNMRMAAAAIGQATDCDDYGMSEREVTYRHNMKKHVIAQRDLSAGMQVGADDLDLKRTSATGEVMRDAAEVVGRKLRRAVPAGQAICREDIQ